MVASAHEEAGLSWLRLSSAPELARMRREERDAESEFVRSLYDRLGGMAPLARIMAITAPDVAPLLPTWARDAVLERVGTDLRHDAARQVGEEIGFVHAKAFAAAVRNAFAPLSHVEGWLVLTLRIALGGGLCLIATSLAEQAPPHAVPWSEAAAFVLCAWAAKSVLGLGVPGLASVSVAAVHAAAPMWGQIRTTSDAALSGADTAGMAVAGLMATLCVSSAVMKTFGWARWHWRNALASVADDAKPPVIYEPLAMPPRVEEWDGIDRRTTWLPPPPDDEDDIVTSGDSFPQQDVVRKMDA